MDRLNEKIQILQQELKAFRTRSQSPEVVSPKVKEINMDDYGSTGMHTEIVFSDATQKVAVGTAANLAGTTCPLLQEDRTTFGPADPGNEINNSSLFNEEIHDHRHSSYLIDLPL